MNPEQIKQLAQWLRNASVTDFDFTLEGRQQVCKPKYLLTRDRDYIISLLDHKLAEILQEPSGQEQRLIAERNSEREGRLKCEAALTAKDKAMGVLFDRLTTAGVDFSDLIS